MEEEWIVAAESGSCQVNDTSADTGWWETALCPPRRTSFLCSQPKGGGQYYLESAFQSVALKLLIYWVCVQSKCCVGLFSCVGDRRFE